MNYIVMINMSLHKFIIIVRRNRMLETLSLIGKKVNQTDNMWGVGGSLLLNFHHLIDKPNDIDILVDEKNTTQFNSIMFSMAESQEAKSLKPFKTAFFSKYRMDQVTIDIMGGFAIEHSEGVYTLPINQESIVEYKKVEGVRIPLCSLEDWYILYWLIPNKQPKAILLENHFLKYGVKHPQLLVKGLERPLPFELKQRIKKLLNI